MSTSTPLQNNNRYTLFKRLGQGGSSTVWHGYDQMLNRQVAIKVFRTFGEQLGVQLCREEYQNTVKLKHPNIIKPFDFGEWGGESYIVMPYYKDGSMHERIGKTSEQEVWQMIHDVGSALDYIHNLTPTELHNDLKPDNFLIAEGGTIVLSDFGISTKLHAHLLRTNVGEAAIDMASKGRGPMAYRAPELFNYKDQKRIVPVKASEIWSFGACIYYIATGEEPFGEQGGMEQLMEHKDRRDLAGKDSLKNVRTLVKPFPPHFSGALESLVFSCLCFESWVRPEAHALVEIARFHLSKQEPVPPKPSPIPSPVPPPLPPYPEFPEEERPATGDSRSWVPMMLMTLAMVLLMALCTKLMLGYNNKEAPGETVEMPTSPPKKNPHPDSSSTQQNLPKPIVEETVPTERVEEGEKLRQLNQIKDRLNQALKNQKVSSGVGCTADLVSITKKIKDVQQLEEAQELLCQEGNDCELIKRYKQSFGCINLRFGVQVGALQTEALAKEESERLSRKYSINNLKIIRKQSSEGDIFLLIHPAKSFEEARNKQIGLSNSIGMPLLIQYKDTKNELMFEKELHAKYKE